MNLARIKELYRDQHPSFGAEIARLEGPELHALLNRALPWLRNLARPSYAAYLGVDLEDTYQLKPEGVTRHVERNYQFDPVDIGRIIAEFGVYVQDKRAAKAPHQNNAEVPRPE